YNGLTFTQILDLNTYEATFFEKHLQKAFAGEPQEFDWWLIPKNGDLVTVNIKLNKGTFRGQTVIICSIIDLFDKTDAQKNILFRNSQLEFVNFLLANLASLKNTDEILRFTIDQLSEKSDVVGGGTYYYCEKENALILSASSGIFSELLLQKKRVVIEGETITNLCGKNKKRNIISITKLFRELFPS